MLFSHKNVYQILDLIPYGKVISYAILADIFCTSPDIIGHTLGQHTQGNKNILHKVIKNKGQALEPMQEKYLLQEGIIIHNHRIPHQYFWKPLITNYYISLITKDTDAIEQFSQISEKIITTNPGKISKTPTNYHITLGDLNNIPITQDFIEKIFMQTNGLHPFIFHCSLHKPYVDTKKEKVIFRVRLENNPFLLTLHHCIKQFVPRKTTNPYIPHITLGKLLKSTNYNPKFLEQHMELDCIFDHICITANIDQQKDMILFEKEIVSPH